MTKSRPYILYSGEYYYAKSKQRWQHTGVT